MSIRFFNPHKVTHGAVSIANCREASVRQRAGDVAHLIGDAKAFPACTAAFGPVTELDILTEDVAAALAIAPGACAALSFKLADAQGGADKTVTAQNAVYLGAAETFAGGKPEAGPAAMRFACSSSDGGTNPLSIA